MAEIPINMDPIGLLDLIDTLRHVHGFDLGTREYLAAQQLAQLWDSSAHNDQQQLKAMLGPVLCTTLAEVEAFERLYTERRLQLFPEKDTARTQSTPTPPRPTPDPNPEKTPAQLRFEKLIRTQGFRRQLIKWGGIILGFAGVLLAIWLFFFPTALAPRGSLQIISIPDSAQVFINNQLLEERTPLLVDTLLPGMYAIHVSAPGYISHVDSLLIFADSTINYPEVHLAEAFVTTMGPIRMNTNSFDVEQEWPQNPKAQLIFTPNAEQIAYGHPASSISLYDIATKRTTQIHTEQSRSSWEQIVNNKQATFNDFRFTNQLNGHTNAVTSVAFSPLGDRIASGSLDNSVRIWDASSGLEITQLNGHTDNVIGIVFSPSGDRIVSGSWDNSVRIWDASSGLEIAQLIGHTDNVISVAINPSGDRIVSGSWDNSVRIWDASSGLEIAQLNGHADYVLSVAFSPSGDRIVSGSRDNSVRIWDTSSGTEIAQLNGHTDNVYGVAFSPSGDRIASGSEDNSVRIWEASSGTEIAQLNGHANAVVNVAFSPSGDRIVSGSEDNSARIWDASSGSEIAQLSGHTDYVYSVAFSPLGNRIVSGSSDNSVRIWDASSGLEIAQLNGHINSVESVAFSHSGDRIASGSDDNTVRIWDTDSGKEIAVLNGHTDAVVSVAFSPSDEHVISGAWDNTSRIWDANSGREILELNGHSDVVNSVAYSPSRNHVISGSDDTTIRIWDTKTGREVGQLNGHTDQVYSVAFNFSGDRIVSAADDSTVRIWDTDSRQQISQLIGNTSDVNAVSFNSSGDRIVSASVDSTVRIWNTNSRREISELNGHSDEVLDAVFSPSGDLIASVADFENEIRVWNAHSGIEVAQLKGHTSTIVSVAFSPSGDRIASVSEDMSVRIWSLKSWHPAALKPLVNEGRKLYGMTREAVIDSAGIILQDYRTDQYADTLLHQSGVELLDISIKNDLYWTQADSTLNFSTYPISDSLALSIKLNQPISALSTFQFGHYVATLHPDSTLRIWGRDTTGLVLKDSLLLDHSNFLAMDTSPDNAQIAVLASDSSLYRINSSPTRKATAFNWILTDGWQWLSMMFLPVLLWLLFRLYHKLRTYYAVREQTQENPELNHVVLKGIQDILFPSLELYRVAQRFRQRLEIPSQKLAPVATVKETIAAGGVFTPVYAERKIRPEYLALIDRSAFEDQQSAHIDDLLNQLKSNEIITRYYFDRDPRVCFPGNPNLRPLSLQNLFRTYPSHRLLIFTEGYGLFNPISGELAHWSDQFNAWDHRFLFTPENKQYWSYRQPLLGEIFVLLPASTEGLGALDEHINEAGLLSSPFKEPFAGAYPDMLRSRPIRWLERDAPEENKVEEMLDSVEAYLGKEGYKWLAACAVYPEMNWKLTTNLAYHMQDAAGQAILNTTTLGALARLPWFRHNYMPDWLRLRLIKTLSRKEEDEIRSILLALLNKAQTNPAGDYDLTFVMQKQDLLQELFNIWIKKGTDLPEEFQDQVFLKFMQDKHHESLLAQVPKAFSQKAKTVRQAGDFRRIRVAGACIVALIGLGIWAWMQIPLSYAPPRLIEVIRPGDGPGPAPVNYWPYIYWGLGILFSLWGLTSGVIQNLSSFLYYSFLARRADRKKNDKRNQHLTPEKTIANNTSQEPDNDSSSHSLESETGATESKKESTVEIKDKDDKSDNSFIELESPLSEPEAENNKNESDKIRYASISDEYQLQLSQLKGHRSTVWSVKFSPSGQYIVSGSDDRTIRIWDANTGTEVQQFLCDTFIPWSVCFSPSGKFIISGSNDNLVRIWNVASGQVIHQLNGHTKGVNSVSVSPSGKYIVSGADDGSVRMWDSESGVQIQVLQGHEKWVNSVAFSPSGKQIVSGSTDKTLYVWDVESGRPIVRLTGHTASVSSVRFNPSSTKIVSGSKDKSVRIWDIELGKEIALLNLHKNFVKSVAFSNKLILSGSDDGSLRVWNADSRDQVFALNLMNEIKSVDISPSEDRIIVGSSDHNIHLLNLTSLPKNTGSR